MPLLDILNSVQEHTDYRVVSSWKEKIRKYRDCRYQIMLNCKAASSYLSSFKSVFLSQEMKINASPYYFHNNMTTPNFKHFLVFMIRQFFALKTPGFKDFCLIFEMEECWASEVTNYMWSYLLFLINIKNCEWQFFAHKIIANYLFDSKF